jgi:F-type H+-transporting ATPase subunit delta
MAYSAKQLAEAFLDLAEDKTGKDLQDAARAYIEWLAKENEKHRIRDIMRQIDKLWKERHGVSNVEVASAQPLTDRMRDKLRNTVDGASINEIVDKNLIGGARLRIDDRVLDGSVKGRLDALKKTLSNA